MSYVASVTHKGRLEILEGLEYKSIRECKDELRANGYKVRFVTTEDKFDEACDKYYEKLNRKNSYNRIKYRLDREEAQRYGCSVKVYRAAWKTYTEKDEKGHYRYNAMSLKDWVEYFKERPEFL